jgi:hypothetical protein
MVGSEMLSAAVDPLAQWIRDGGVLYATGGGGLLDEYHRNNTALYEIYGLKAHKLDRAVRGIRPRDSLRGMTPLDAVVLASKLETLEIATMPALCYRDALQPVATAEVLGTYKSDGSPAIFYHAYGKGAVVYSGVLVGLAYLAPAMPPSSDVLPQAFPAALRSLIALPVLRAKIARPVVTDNPLVESQYLSGPNGAVVILVNWTEGPVGKLTIRFPHVPVKAVQSLRAAGYFKGALDEQPKGRLPVQVVDGVPQVQLRLEVTDYLYVD